MPHGLGRDNGRAMNREEDDHGCSQEEGEEIQIEEEDEEDEEGHAEKESGEALRPEEISVEEESGAKKEGCIQEVHTKKIRAQEAPTEEIRAEEAAGFEASASSPAAPGFRRRRAEPGHLSPVQPAGWRRQFG